MGDGITTRLSILDNTVAHFAPCAAAWIFDAPSSSPSLESCSPDQLLTSFCTTLESYPQWAGQLRFVPYDPKPSRGHLGRQGRIILTHNAKTDPGVHFVIAKSSCAVSDHIPNLDDRTRKEGYLDVTSVPLDELLPSSPSLALNDDAQPDAPSMIVQITRFACGGVAIAVMMAHALADAQSLVQFVSSWASVHRAALRGDPAPSVHALFDPLLLDAAAGSINAALPDQDLTSVAQALPRTRGDWWASAEGCPWRFHVPREVPKDDIWPPANAIPWEEFDMHAPVKHVLLHFPEKVLGAMRDGAQEELGDSALRLSKLDVMQAHVWGLIIHAQGRSDAKEEDEEEEYKLNLSLGARTRLQPPLPPSFLGSPIFGALATSTPSHTLSQRALAIRHSISTFTPAAVAAILHEEAYTIGAQRIWNMFLGRRHTISTSWLRLGIYDVDLLGEGAGARYVDAMMPSMDGCVQFMEAGRDPSEGLCVSLHLRVEVMTRLLDAICK